MSDGINGETRFMKDDEQTVMSIVFTGSVRDRSFSATSMLVRMTSGMVVIEVDKTNKPLVDALLQTGVARETIVLAYAGETVETA